MRHRSSLTSNPVAGHMVRSVDSGDAKAPRGTRPEGLCLVAVSVDDSSDAIDRFRVRLSLRFPILWDPEQRAANDYQAYRFPGTLLEYGLGSVQ